ncbi:hypothetical protein M404DRAFT_35342 [Pisolithus tinctorius Marx 270]|uniref:Uncharacterized protein n=1 Tax=Pisolithus tinctorius Marx 270 TaxID=870435 RepID=A0A0C3NEG4_PISTI|nr:hypothetical protein M404DRAFT_35342 [Pisolithus tinctorius Marx 270]
MEVEQATQDAVKAKPVKPKPKLKGRQGRPTNISDLPRGEVANIEVEAHHVTADDFLGSSNKPPRRHNMTELLGDDVATSACAPNLGKSQYVVLFPCTMLLLLTESTLFWLNLTWNVSALNNRTLLAGHVKSWASSVTPVGNGTPRNSVTSGSQVQTDGTPNLPPSTVPSLTTKATSVSSEISIAEDDQEHTMPQESTERHMISNDVPAAAHDEDEHYFRDPLTISAKFMQYQKPVEAMVCTTNTSGDAKSDLEVENPISHAVQAGLKHRHADHDNVEYVSSSEVENADDGGSFCDLHDVNIRMKVVKELCVTTMTNIRIDKPAKKAKPGSRHGYDRCIHFINANLPEELQEDRRWLKQMLPTLLMWAGSFADPWAIPDLELMTALRIITTSLVSDFDSHAVCPGTPTFVLATRQLGLWCSNFSSTAIALITHFLASDPDDDAQSAAAVR